MLSGVNTLRICSAAGRTRTDKRTQHESRDFYAHMALVHVHRFARCFVVILKIAHRATFCIYKKCLPIAAAVRKRFLIKDRFELFFETIPLGLSCKCVAVAFVYHQCQYTVVFQHVSVQNGTVLKGYLACPGTILLNLCCIIA